MIKQLEIWDIKENGFIKVNVTLKRSKGFKKLFDHARKSIITQHGERIYEPYWFEGLDVENKNWWRGGWYSDNLGLINLRLTGENVQGVVLNGNELYLLTKVEKIN